MNLKRQFKTSRLIMLTIITFMLFLTLSVYLPVTRVYAGTQYTLEGLTLAPNTPHLTPGVLKGWSEGDWVPYILTIDNSQGGDQGLVTIMLDLDYHISHQGNDLFGIDAFKSCFSDIDPTTCNDVNTGTIGEVLENGVSTAVSIKLTTPSSGSNDVVLVTLAPIDITAGSTFTVEWSNHLAKSSGPNFVQYMQNVVVDSGIPNPTDIVYGAGFWPGARIHEGSDVSGGITGHRDVPINPLPNPTQGTSSISTSVYDTGFCATLGSCPNTGGTEVPPATAYVGDSLYDTATLKVSGDSNAIPTGDVHYYFFLSGDCSGDFAAQLVDVQSDGSVSNSLPTDGFLNGGLGAGDYSFQAVYSGDLKYQGSTSDCEPFTVNPFSVVAPQITKTATPSFTLTYGWTVNKLCSFDNVHFYSTCTEDTTSSSVQVYYKITVTHDTGTPSNWQVTGDIYVNNPNLGSFSYDSVTDNIVDSTTHATTDAGATCPVSLGNDAAYQNTGTFSPSGGAIPAGDTVDFTYTCTYSAAPSPNGEVNRATVSWSTQTISFTDNGITHSASLAGSSQPAFSTDWSWSTTVTPTVVNNCVQVVDSQQGTLGTVCVGNPNPRPSPTRRHLPSPRTLV